MARRPLTRRPARAPRRKKRATKKRKPPATTGHPRQTAIPLAGTLVRPTRGAIDLSGTLGEPPAAPKRGPQLPPEIVAVLDELHRLHTTSHPATPRRRPERARPLRPPGRPRRVSTFDFARLRARHPDWTTPAPWRRYFAERGQSVSRRTISRMLLEH